MFVLRSTETGMFLTRFPAYNIRIDTTRQKGFGAVWWNDRDLQSFAWVKNPLEARKATLPADILGMLAGLDFDPDKINVLRFEGDTLSPVGTLAELISKGIEA